MYYAIMKDIEFSNGHKVKEVPVYGYKTKEEADKKLNLHSEIENTFCYVKKVVMDKQKFIEDFIDRGYILLDNDLILYKTDDYVLVWKIIFEAKESEENGYEESLYLKLLSKSEIEE